MKLEFRNRTMLRSKTVILAFNLAVVFSNLSCTPDPEKRPSPLRSDSAKMGLINAYVEYSSPGVKERKIFGSGDNFLVPYGKLWRTGANNATYISFDRDVLIDSLLLDSGSYSLFTIPNKNKWVIILNREWKQWGSYDYKDSLDALRLMIRPTIAKESQERMLFYFADDSLKFRWEKIRWAIPVRSLP